MGSSYRVDTLREDLFPDWERFYDYLERCFNSLFICFQIFPFVIFSKMNFGRGNCRGEWHFVFCRPQMWHLPLVPVDLSSVSTIAALGRLLQAWTHTNGTYCFFLLPGLLWTSLLPNYRREFITQGTFTPLEMKQIENAWRSLDGCSVCFSGEPAGLSPRCPAVMLTVSITSLPLSSLSLSPCPSSQFSLSIL